MSLRNLTVQPNLAYDADLEPPLRAIDVLTEGQLQVMDIEGNTVSYPLVAYLDAAGEYTTFPFRLEMNILRIIGDGAGSVGTAPETDIALNQLVGLH